MPRTIKKHYHVLRLKRGQKYNDPMEKKIFSCQDPECWFYTSAYNLIGKRVMCPQCLRDFVCDREDLTKAKPHCKNCTRSTKAKKKIVELQTIEQRLQDVLSGKI